MHIWDTSMYRIAPGRVCNAILLFLTRINKFFLTEQPLFCRNLSAFSLEIHKVFLRQKALACNKISGCPQKNNL